MEENKEYFVFISYSSLDNEWAIWLRHELEHYHLPASFNGRKDVRDNLRKVFRDRDELSAGPEWDEQVSRALAATNNLIVICSPNAAKSEAVNKEVEAFIALGKEDHIFPFIVEGDKPKDCFPSALKHSKLGGDVNKDGGRDSAFVKVVSGMLKVGFPSLWDRYEKEKAEEERKIREQRDKLLIMQSRFLAEKANDLVDKGDSYTAMKLSLYALPKYVENPDRPYVKDAEVALRKAYHHNGATLRKHPTRDIDSISLVNVRHIVSVSNDSPSTKRILLWDIDSGKILLEFCNIENTGFCHPLLSSDEKLLVSNHSVNTICLWKTTSELTLVSSIEFDRQVSSMAFSPTNKQLCVAFNEGTIRILDTTNKQDALVIKGHTDYINSVNYSYDGKFIISASDDYSVRVWNSKTGGELYKIEHNHCVKSALFSPDGKFIASEGHNYTSGNSVINLWDTNTRNIIFSLKGSSAAFSKDSQLIGTSLDADIHIYSTEKGTEISIIKDGIKKYSIPRLGFLSGLRKDYISIGKRYSHLEYKRHGRW